MQCYRDRWEERRRWELQSRPPRRWELQGQPPRRHSQCISRRHSSHIIQSRSRVTSRQLSPRFTRHNSNHLIRHQSLSQRLLQVWTQAVRRLHHPLHHHHRRRHHQHPLPQVPVQSSCQQFQQVVECNLFQAKCLSCEKWSDRLKDPVP